MDKTTFQNRVLAAEQLLYRVSKTLLKRDEDCADAVQEAILKAWSALPTLREERYFTTWLTRILINECYAILRRNERITDIEAIPETAAPERSFSSLYEALTALPEKTRVAVELHYIEGYSVAEVAEILKIPEGTVKSRLSGGRKLLKRFLEE
ncbi:MAG: RNA polymerase sigma factor [Clostridia bacterium]|nr:RNA polymerase sigma factor [Clostridia bacterium]